MTEILIHRRDVLSIKRQRFLAKKDYVLVNEESLIAQTLVGEYVIILVTIFNARNSVVIRFSLLLIETYVNILELVNVA